jgi:tetratricopeptide (TPR) repeat protein
VLAAAPTEPIEKGRIVAKDAKAAAQPTGLPEFSDADKSRARKWFTKATQLREKRDYDYAIECYINGLSTWPEAVEEGHMPLRSLAVQRHQAGGSKPGLLDGMKKSMSGKDAKKAMLNAEHLLSMDPQNAGYAEGLLRNANKANYLETCKWIAPVLVDMLKKEKKPNKSRFENLRKIMVEASEKSDELGLNQLETFFLEQAVSSLEFYATRVPGDESTRNEIRDLAGRLTISRGKYDDDGDFRDSLQDAESQKLLHDAQRLRQGDESYAALVAAARKEFEENPDVPGKINAYVDVLLKAEREEEESQAIETLVDAFKRLRNYSFKSRADDIRMRQLQRRERRLETQARESGKEEDRQQARLAALEYRQVLVDIFRERVAKYPTDLRLKYKLGTALFAASEFDEAIPVLQVAQQDPRTRVKCQLLLGRSFFEKGSPKQAAEVLREALDKYDQSDETAKHLLYWLARSFEAAENLEEARDAYGRLLRQDYNFMDGDARKRLERLQES